MFSDGLEWRMKKADWKVQILAHHWRVWTQRPYLIHDCHHDRRSHFTCCRSNTGTSPTSTEVEKSTLGQCCNCSVCLSSQLPLLSANGRDYILTCFNLQLAQNLESAPTYPVVMLQWRPWLRPTHLYRSPTHYFLSFSTFAKVCFV